MICVLKVPPLHSEFSVIEIKRVFHETIFLQFAYIMTRKIIDWSLSKLVYVYYAENEHTVEIIALFKVPFLTQKAVKKW